MRLTEQQEGNLELLRRIVEARVRDIVNNSYEMEDPDVSTDFEDESESDMDSDVAPYNGAAPKPLMPTNRMPFISPDTETLGAHVESSIGQKGQSVVWQERDLKNPSLQIVYHGTVIDKMGSILKIKVDTYEVKGKLKRSVVPVVKYMQSKAVRVDVAPPSIDAARALKH